MLSPRTLKIIRRIHLYLGLLLLPWVLLYGASALLFNHSTWMSEREQQVISAETLVAAGWPRWESSEAFATALEHDLGRPVDDSGSGGSWSVRAPRLAGGFDVRFADADATHRLWIHGDGEAAVLWSSPRSDMVVHEARLEEGARSGTFDAYAEEARQRVPALLAELGFADAQPTVRRVPTVRFDVPRAGGLLRGEYEVGGEVVVEDPSRAGLAGRVRESLLDLHTSHGYGARGGVRAAWGVLVDLMGGAMLLWGVSGLLMWWQLLRTRRWGVVCLGVSTVAAAVLGVGMLRLFAG